MQKNIKAACDSRLSSGALIHINSLMFTCTYCKQFHRPVPLLEIIREEKGESIVNMITEETIFLGKNLNVFPDPSL